MRGGSFRIDWSRHCQQGRLKYFGWTKNSEGRCRLAGRLRLKIGWCLAHVLATLSSSLSDSPIAAVIVTSAIQTHSMSGTQGRATPEQVQPTVLLLYQNLWEWWSSEIARPLLLTPELMLLEGVLRFDPTIWFGWSLIATSVTRGYWRRFCTNYWRLILWAAVLRVRSSCMLDFCSTLSPYSWYQEYKISNLAFLTSPPTLPKWGQPFPAQSSTRWSLPSHSCTWKKRQPTANPDYFWRDNWAAPSTYHHSYEFLRVRREALPSFVLELVALLYCSLKGGWSAKVILGNYCSELNSEFSGCPDEFVDDLVGLVAQFNFPLRAS